jgi:hypothetical protein
MDEGEAAEHSLTTTSGITIEPIPRLTSSPIAPGKHAPSARRPPAIPVPPDDEAGRTAWNLERCPADRRIVVQVLAATFGVCCAICETDVDLTLEPPHPGAPQIDHVLPQSHGGKDVWGNVRLTHASCNDSRQAALDLDCAAARELLARRTADFADPVLWNALRALDLQGRVVVDLQAEDVLARFQRSQPTEWREQRIERAKTDTAKDLAKAREAHVRLNTAALAQTNHTFDYGNPASVDERLGDLRPYQDLVALVANARQ